MKLFIVTWGHRHGRDAGLVKALSEDLLQALPDEKLIELVFGDCEFNELDKKRLAEHIDSIEIREQEGDAPEFPFEMKTDGETVWVNTPLCIGRFGRISGEIQKHNGKVVNIVPPDWDAWTAAMTNEHGVDFEGFNKPAWCNE